MAGNNLTYSMIMSAEPTHLVLKLDLKKPIEVGDFADLFSSLAKTYEKQAAINETKHDFRSKIYIKEIKKGSIIAEIIPQINQLFEQTESAVLIGAFILELSKFIKEYGSGKRIKKATQSDLKNILDVVKSIAKDDDGSATISKVTYKDGKKKQEVALEFDTKTAQKAAATINSHLADLNEKKNDDFNRVLMVFEQSNTKASQRGKRSGEKVIIESISPQSKPIIYQSDIAEQKIKHEIIEGDKNIYKKGFIVDANIELLRGKPAAYRIKHVHDIIDLD